MSTHRFNDQQIRWNRLGEFPHLWYTVLNIDAPRQAADVLFKFAAGQQIQLHRHMALNHTFVVQGEHYVYEPDGRLKEIRPTGSYTTSPANPEPHREGGGPDQDVIVLFSIRGSDGVLYEILDDAQNRIATITMQDLTALYAAQRAAVAEAAAA